MLFHREGRFREMKMFVDFNMRDADGAVLALVETHHRGLKVGDVVEAEDAEGNQCRARIVKIAQNRATVAHLVLEEGASESFSSAAG